MENGKKVLQKCALGLWQWIPSSAGHFLLELSSLPFSFLPRVKNPLISIMEF